MIIGKRKKKGVEEEEEEEGGGGEGEEEEEDFILKVKLYLQIFTQNKRGVEKGRGE